MPTSDASNGAWLAVFTAFWLVWLLIVCAIMVLHIVLYWRIAAKAGYSGIFGLLMFVPLVNLIVLIYFAFTEWPIEQELHRHGGAPPPGTSVMPA